MIFQPHSCKTMESKMFWFYEVFDMPKSVGIPFLIFYSNSVIWMSNKTTYIQSYIMLQYSYFIEMSDFGNEHQWLLFILHLTYEP